MYNKIKWSNEIQNKNKLFKVLSLFISKINRSRPTIAIILKRYTMKTIDHEVAHAKKQENILQHQIYACDIASIKLLTSHSNWARHRKRRIGDKVVELVEYYDFVELNFPQSLIHNPHQRVDKKNIGYSTSQA